MDIVALVAAFSAGEITRDAIRRNYGDSVLSQVLSLAGAAVVGQVAYDLVDSLNPLDDFFDF